MKVFISWGGEPSLAIALALRQWLPRVAQFTEPWMSRQDLESGEMWNEQVAAQLDQTTYGIICVTAANQERPWLNFEAGALAKRVAEPARVVPLCIDLEPGALNTGPLASFQGLKLDKDGMRKLVRDIHARRENPMPVPEVDEIFDDTWHRLATKVEEAKAKAAGPQPKPRDPRDMLEELVERVRRIERNQPPSSRDVLRGDLVTIGGRTYIPRNEDEAQLLHAARFIAATTGEPAVEHLHHSLAGIIELQPPLDPRAPTAD